MLITEIIDNLNKILEETEPAKTELIKSLQNKIWYDESIKDDTLNEILTELSYDLDFYEPNEEWRREDISYYGSKRLEEVLKFALYKLKEKSKI